MEKKILFFIKMDTRKKILDYERRHGLDLRLRRAFNQALLGAGASGTTIPMSAVLEERSDRADPVR